MLSLSVWCRRYAARPYSQLFIHSHISCQICCTHQKCTSVVFSGIQPTGVPQLGNYLGAVKNWVKLQDEFTQPIFSVVDLHALTKPSTANQRRQDTLDSVIALLACGVNPEKSILFKQSEVKEHAELCWILTCMVTEARLKQIPQWKEKAKNKKLFNFGLISYPVLMSADIMLYKATHVPVGEDQLQHLQLCRDLSSLFNVTYDQELFPLCEWLLTEVPRIKSLRDPTAKMSKSDNSDKSRINLNDSAEVITLKIKQALTDCTGKVYHDSEKRPGVSNLMDIHSALTGLSHSQIESQTKGIDTGKYKGQVSDAVIAELMPIQERMTQLRMNMDYVERTLADGKFKAREIASRTLDETKLAIGL